MKRITERAVRMLAVALALAAGPAAAQEMGQGEANITAQADVRLSMESGPGTNADKLALIGGVVGSKLGAVRNCYREVTA